MALADVTRLAQHAKVAEDVDADLYSSVLVALIAQRNLLVSTADVALTAQHVEYVVSAVLRLSVAVVDCTHQTVPSDGVLVLVNLDKTTAAYQRQIRSVFTTRHDPVVCVVHNDDGVEVGLAEEINRQLLFRCAHEPEQKEPITGAQEQLAGAAELVQVCRDRVKTVVMVQEVTRYINDILIHLRNHRMVAGGVPIFYKYELETMVKAVAVLNGLDYVSPDVVKMCSLKFWPLHLNLIESVKDEPTLHWGSDRRLADSFLQKWDQDLVVVDVLNNVQPPL